MPNAHPSVRSPRAHSLRLLAGSVCCACLMLLAACGTSTSSGLGRRSGQPTETPVVRVTVGATTPSTGTIEVPGGVTNCGAVYEGADGAQPANALDIEACLYTAFQSCRPAALLYTNMGVDTQENYLFVVQPGANGTCGIARTVKNIGCCGGTSHLIQTTDRCSGVVKQNNAYVVLACGKQGNITLPS